MASKCIHFEHKNTKMRTSEELQEDSSVINELEILAQRRSVQGILP